MNIAQVRAQYPQYQDLSDKQLADALHAKFYSDIPIQDYYGRIGLTSPKERTFGEAAKDIAAGVVSGAGNLVQLPGQLYGLATGDFSETGALGVGKDIAKYGEEMKSAGLKAREAERAEKIKTAEQKGQWEAFKTAFGETIKDPALLTSFLAEQAPQLLVPFGAAKVAQIGTAAKAAAAAQGLTGTAAKEAVEAVTKEAARRGTAAAVGAGAVQQGADVGAQAYEDIFKELKSKGATDADAAQGAINLARASGASGALISLLAQRLPGAKTLEETFAGVRGPGGRLVGAARGALGEGASEIVEETGGKFGANLAMREVKPEQSLLEGLGATAGMAAIGGVGMGGVSGALQRPGEKIEIINGKKFIDGKPVEPEAPAAPVSEPVAPDIETEKPMITRVMNMASQQNGYGLLEQQKQRLLAEPQTEDTKKELTLIQEIQDRMNIETAQRMTPSGKSPFIVTPDALTELGIKPTAPIIKRLDGKSFDDPVVIEQLEKYAANKNVDPEVQQSVLAFVEQLRQSVAETPVTPGVPAAPEMPAAPPVAPAPVSEAPPAVEPPAPPVTPTVETPAPAAEMPAPPVEAAAPVAEAPVVEDAEPPAPAIDQKALEEKRQMIADMIETKKANREPVPEAWIKRLADLSAQLRGETISEGETYSMEVAGHPLFDGPPVLRNLIPIKVKDSDAAQRALDRALDLEKQFATEFYGARQALSVAKTAAQKKAAQARIKKLNDQGWDEDALKTLRNETIQELSRLVDVTQKSAPKAEALAVEAPTPAAEPAAPPTLDTTGIKEVKGRHPQVQAAAKLLQDKKMTREEFEKYVDYYKPIQEVEAEKLLPPTSEQKMNETVNADKRDRINVPVEDGTKVGLRMDLPARERGGSVVSIHEGKPGKLTVGKLMGFRSTGWLKDVTFEVRSQEKGLSVATGASKAPQQTVEGTWQNLSPEETYARVKELMKDPAWKQIGFDPSRHGYFYDRKTREPVVSASEMYQVGQFLLAKDVQYAPKTDFLYSVEPTIKSDRVPSYKRGVENLRKRWEKGDLTSDEFAARVDILAKQVEMAELAKEKAGRERGADFLRQKLLEAKRRGELSPEAVDFAEWFILQNPALVDDLGISIRTPKEDGVGGMYSSYGRVMYLMKERGSDQTVVHEILHHLERMMPKEVQSAIRKTWIKSLMEAQKSAKTDAEKQFFKNLTDFHFGFGARSLMKAAIDAIKEGDVSKDLYQYTSPSEFWAENGSEIMKGRFDVKGSILGRLKQWLSELKEKARSLFGLENKAAIIRALDSLSKGDGKFVTSTLLDETTEPKFSITPAGTPGQQALETINRMGMGVKPPEPGKFAKLQKILEDAGENPAGTKASAKAALTKWLDWFETISFSGDAAFANKVQRSVIADMKENEEVLGKLLELSQSQAVNADNVVSRGLIEGSIEYNEEMKKWQSVKKDENFAALIGKLEELSKKYGTSAQEMERIAHAYLVAKRLPGIIKRNEELDAEIKAEEATAKPDRKSIDKWKSLKVYVSPEQEAMVDDGISLGKTIPELSQISDMWNAIRKNNIAVMVESGLYTPEYAQQLWDNMDYVPYYREEQLEADAGPTEFIRGLQVKAKEFQLKGSGAAVNDVFENMMLWSQYAMNRAIRADKARRMIDVAKDIDIGDRKMAVQVTEEKRGMNIVRIFRDGKQELWDVADPMFVDAFASIQNVSIPMFKWAAKVADVLRNSVVLYPMFSVAQVPQDSFAAMFTSGLKPQHALKIPILAVKEFIKTLNKTSATHNELVKYGVVGARNFSAEVMRQDAEIFAGLKPPKGGWNKTKDFLEHIAMSADNAVRQAVYEAAQQQGVSKQEALEKAFEIFNVRRRGTSKALNLAGQTIPFFYAYLAAQRVAYRTITGVGTSPTERKAALQTLAATSAAVFTLSMLYAMMVADDEDYAETPAAVRDRTLTIPGTGGVRIPLRADFFLFPKMVAEHTYLMLTDQGYEDGAKFRRSMRDGLVNAIASPTPLPQIAKPALEVLINYSFFDGKPVIGTFEKQKDMERQFNDSTSEFSKLLGQTGLVSPIAADHLIRGMLGSAGGLALYGTNMFLHSDPDVPRPEMSAKEMLAALPGTSGFLKRPQESALKNDFFVLRDEVEKAVNTFNDIKTRSPQGIEDFLADEKQMARLMLGKPVDKINRELSKIRKVITQMTNMPESQMSAEEKSENIRQLREVEREILKSVNVKALREMAKI